MMHMNALLFQTGALRLLPVQTAGSRFPEASFEALEALPITAMLLVGLLQQSKAGVKGKQVAGEEAPRIRGGQIGLDAAGKEVLRRPVTMVHQNRLP